jgi:hypothetical protein
VAACTLPTTTPAPPILDSTLALCEAFGDALATDGFFDRFRNQGATAAEESLALAMNDIGVTVWSRAADGRWLLSVPQSDLPFLTSWRDGVFSEYSQAEFDDVVNQSLATVGELHLGSGSEGLAFCEERPVS